jgi:outer membrane protein assembly factor BamB
MDIDSSRNIYLCGNNASGAWVGKFNSSGTRQWEVRTNTTGNPIFDGIKVDSSGNVFAGGGYTESNNEMLAVKFNSSGTLQWQRNAVLPQSEAFLGATVDSSGNAYFGGYRSNGTKIFGQLLKYDTNGNNQFQKQIEGTGGNYNVFGTAITTSSAGSVYLVGSTSQNGSYTDRMIAKYDTSGNIQWYRTLRAADTTEYRGVTTDSSENVFAVGSTNAGYPSIVKYDSSGSIQWQRQLTAPSTSFRGCSAVCDSSGNLYVLVDGQGSTSVLIVKYDTSGTVVWQRRLLSTGYQLYAGTIKIDSSDNLYIGIRYYTGSSFRGLFAILPSDGSKTGSYTVNDISLTYSSYSGTSSTTTSTHAAPGNTSYANSAMTLGTSGFTISSTTSSVTKTGI